MWDNLIPPVFQPQLPGQFTPVFYNSSGLEAKWQQLVKASRNQTRR